jgi:hypothetical protein
MIVLELGQGRCDTTDVAATRPMSRQHDRCRGNTTDVTAVRQTHVAQPCTLKTTDRHQTT